MTGPRASNDDGTTMDLTALQAELVALRRSLHAYPEIGLDLPQTQRRVLDALHGLDLEISTGRQLSSVTAVLRGAQPGPAVLLRADMDALPVDEASGVDYASRIPGAMHACGHDLHTAMLVGAARMLAARRSELHGDVVLMFQPGEEGCDGAARMIDEGVLDAAGQRVIAAFGMHVRSHGGRRGVFVARPGTMMGGTANVSITVRGAGGHGAFPHLARDPITVAAEIVLALQTQVTRRYDVFDPVVVTVGAMRAGTAANVIPAEAHLDATVRTFSTATQDRVAAEITGLCEGIAAAHGLIAEVGYDPGYPVTVNDADRYDFAAAAVVDVLGADRFERLEHPVAAAEDFSRVLNAVPGCYLVLNAAGADDPLTAAVNHSPQAVFDDSVLTDGALIHTELAIRTLAEHADPGARREELHATR